MVRSRKRYREIFESLMQYTDFKNSEEIKTKQDLTNFFEQVRKDARSKGGDFRTGNLFEKIEQEVIISRVNKEKVVSPTIQAIQSSKTYSTVSQAKNGGGLVQYDNRKIYKSSFLKNNKTFIRWKDSKGRFAKTPKTEEK